MSYGLNKDISSKAFDKRLAYVHADVQLSANMAAVAPVPWQFWGKPGTKRNIAQMLKKWAFSHQRLFSSTLQYLRKSVRSFVHNILLVGSPGADKTLLARAVPGILPEMSIEESLDVTRMYSVADQLPAGMPLIKHRPFRSLHHTISHAGLVGGGNVPKPGEISLAHRRVLFLDEFPEFGTRVFEVMRQPMEDKVVTISRAKGLLTFPANFQLIAAMNPYPCGFYGDTQKPCTCAHALVTKYQKRISGPLLDRIDIHIEVPRVDYEKLSGDRVGESSESIRARVQAARNIQRNRFSENGSTDIICNADMRIGEIRQFCKLPEDGQSLMRAEMSQLNLSARAYHRTAKRETRAHDCRSGGI